MLSHEDQAADHRNKAVTYLHISEGYARQGETQLAAIHAINAATHFKWANKHQFLATRPGSESVSNPLSQ